MICDHEDSVNPSDPNKTPDGAPADAGKGGDGAAPPGGGGDPGGSSDLPLLPQHLVDLRGSGLSDKTIRTCCFVTLEGDPVRKLLHWKGGAEKLGPCLGFPFFDLDGKRPADLFGRVKPDRPRPGKTEGKVRKYEQPFGVPVRPYYPRHGLALLLNPAEPLLITEGEKKACKGAQEGFATVGLVGVDMWSVKRKKDANGKGIGKRRLLPGLTALKLDKRAVYVVFDSDAIDKKEVLRAERSMAAALQEAGSSVKIVRLPPGENGAKVGLDDYLCTHSADDLRKLMADAKPAIQTGGRTVVILSTDEDRVTRDVTAALAQDSCLFQRDGVVVRPHVTEQGEQRRLPLRGRAACIVRPAGMTVLRRAEVAHVRLRITAQCCLATTNEKKELKLAHPPEWLAPGVLVQPGAIRPVEGVLLGPTLAHDGRLIDCPGYDDESQWFLARGVHGLSVPKYPNIQQAKEAAAILWDLVSDFPFQTDADRARYLCLLLTACLRHLIPRTPIGMITANVAGSGKTYLGRLISIIAHGLPTPILMTWPEGTQMMTRGDEIRKRLVSLLAEGASFVLIDNLPRGEPFGSPELDAFVTADAMHDRLLGKNDGSRVGGPNRCLLICTGNNITPYGDTSDRTMLVRLLCNNPNPRSRPMSDYKIANLEEHVLAERAHYLGAALTIWRAWIRDECPQPGGASWGTFEVFVDSGVAVVRWLGLPDPIGDRVKEAQEHDGESRAIETLLYLWKKVLKTDEPLACSAILKGLEDGPIEPATPNAQAMREALGVLGAGSRWPPTSQKLGRVLQGYKNRPIHIDVDGKPVRLTLVAEPNSDTKNYCYFVKSEPFPVSGVSGVSGVHSHTPRGRAREEEKEEGGTEHNSAYPGRTWPNTGNTGNTGNPPPEPPADDEEGVL